MKAKTNTFELQHQIMQQEKYPFIKGKELYYYEFFSEGPKGRIKKVIRYSLIQQYPVKIYNVGFGDWIENEIDDTTITNNKDRQKILLTVADTVIDFMQFHPDSFIFAQGSTGARTRLYQMGIASFYDDISGIFTILGFADDNWQVFEKGKNYKAFLVKKK